MLTGPTATAKAVTRRADNKEEGWQRIHLPVLFTFSLEGAAFGAKLKEIAACKEFHVLLESPEDEDLDPNVWIKREKPL